MTSIDFRKVVAEMESKVLTTLVIIEVVCFVLDVFSMQSRRFVEFQHDKEASYSARYTQ